ncbi:hypothetical protein FQR65_LT14687 [Abscondita terminalis]|nr:hypothetical protein FQR65_LT14687 [Abscondita terminalis]
MKMPPQKPVGNGYYGYEDVPHLSENNAMENSTTAPLSEPPEHQAPSNADNDFAEYLWMENEEEFDKQVMQQLEEEELMEQCIEAMLEEEHRNINDERSDRINHQESQQAENNDVTNLVNNFKLDLIDVTKSTLNPLAAEFVPDARSTSPTTSE